MTKEEFEKKAAEVLDTLYENVYLPNFVKLAQAKGVTLSTWEDVDSALVIAGELEQRQLAQSGSLLKSAAAELTGKKPSDAREGQQPEYLDALVKEATANPTVIGAIVDGLKLNQEAAAAQGQTK
jgi:hypothetical protein